MSVDNKKYVGLRKVTESDHYCTREFSGYKDWNNLWQGELKITFLMMDYKVGQVKDGKFIGEVKHFSRNDKIIKTAFYSFLITGKEITEEEFRKELAKKRLKNL